MKKIFKNLSNIFFIWIDGWMDGWMDERINEWKTVNEKWDT